MNNVSLTHVYAASVVSGVVAVIIAFVLGAWCNPQIKQLENDRDEDRAISAFTDATSRLLVVQQLIRVGDLEVPRGRQVEVENCERDAAEQLGNGEIEAARESIRCIYRFVNEECPAGRIELCDIVKEFPPFEDFDSTA